MPKETVQDTSGDFDVRVGWLAAGDVQVGVETAAGHSLVTKLYGNIDTQRSIAQAVAAAVKDRPATIGDAEFGRQILDIIEASSTNPSGSYTGVHASLDRHGCNRLIRLIRQARDTAFGSDA